MGNTDRAGGDHEGISRRFLRMFSPHSLIQNALVNVIKQSLNLKFAKSRSLA